MCEPIEMLVGWPSYFFAGEGTIVEYEGSVHAALFSREECVKAFILMSQRIKRAAEKTQDDDVKRALPPTESTFHLSNKL
jgi:hypothetical protein